MAAFESVGKPTVQPHNRDSLIDYRSARLPSLKPDHDEYNPLEHRNPQQPIKLWMAYFNLIRAGFGAGVLGFPLAISQCGIVLGPLLALFTGLLVTHTHLMLLWCLNEISRQLKIPSMSYRYGFRLALLNGPPIVHCIAIRGPNLIATLMIISQVGICTVFIDFTSDSLRDILDWRSTRMAMLTLLVPYMLLEFFMKSLKIISYCSMAGNFLNVIGLTLIFYHIFKYPHGEFIKASNEALPVLFAFGTFLFNLCAVGVILSVDKALEKAEWMTKKMGIITVGMLVPTLIATVFGVLGYWSFGTMEENVLRSLPYDDDAAMVSIGLYLISVALAYPIQCYPGTTIIIEIVTHNLVEHTERNQRIVEFISRPVFVLLTFFIASMVPFQAPFVAFVGNLCTTMLALVCPAFMEICLMYPGPYGKYNFYLIKDIMIMIIGLISWMFGAVLCAYLMYIRVIGSASPNDSDYF